MYCAGLGCDGGGLFRHHSLLLRHSFHSRIFVIATIVWRSLVVRYRFRLFRQDLV